MIQFEAVGFSYGRADGSEGTSLPTAASGACVREVTFAVAPGTCTLVCGPSGCGKTTVTRLANGLAPTFYPGPMTGRVLVDGRDAAALESWEMAASVGSVFQNPRTQFFNTDTAGEVAFALESLAWPEPELRARVAEVMAELGIEGLAGRSLFALSGGEKQRVAYGSAWAPRPANLVLDEPTSNLDLDAIDDLRRYLRAAKEAGCAVLVAEHRLWWLADLVDEVLLMNEGQVRRRWTGDEFRALSPQVLAQEGLRVRDLGEVGPCRHGQPAAPSPAQGPVLVRAQGIEARHGKRIVLGPADFTLRRGEVVALVGPNGAGKTTLCRTVAGLHEESAGELCLADEDGALRPARPRERLRRAAMVFQDVNYQLFAESVTAEVTFGLPKGQVDEARVQELLEQLGLVPWAKRHPATLSGGQKQRLAVAACLAAGKDLVMFDEPTSGLDRGAMEAVGALVRAVAASGAAVLVVTHDLEFIVGACDAVWRVEEGALTDACPASDSAAVRRLMGRALTPECDDRTQGDAAESPERR